MTESQSFGSFLIRLTELSWPLWPGYLRSHQAIEVRDIM
jgi:hypothetical protein